MLRYFCGGFLSMKQGDISARRLPLDQAADDNVQSDRFLAKEEVPCEDDMAASRG
jgi:hypothetical protein